MINQMNGMSYKSDDNLLKLLTEENMPNFREFFLVNEIYFAYL